MPSVDVVANALAAAGVEAVAVVFLHAYINPAHEMAAAAWLRMLLPGVAVTASQKYRASGASTSGRIRPFFPRMSSRLWRAISPTWAEHSRIKG